MPTDKAETIFCSQLSRQAGEPLFASATPTSLYLLLEFQGEWGGKALEESSLPEAVKERLKSFTKANPGAKTLLIRKGTGKSASAMAGTSLQPRNSQQPSIAFYAALVGERDRQLYSFSLGAYQELLDIELEAFLSNGGGYQAQRSQEQFILVCTNGRRDKCCNKYGVPVYNQLSAAAVEYPGLRVWQSTHIGGHRFAANLLWLPQGVLFGRVDPSSADEILASLKHGQIYLPNLRGRTALPEPAQAADYFLRQRSQEYRADAFQLLEVQQRGENHWLVSFLARDSGEPLQVELVREIQPAEVYESCALDKATHVTQYRLIE